MDSIAAYILENELKAGDKLPSQVDMAKQLNVSRTSLREALAQLEAREVIRQIQGMGTYVASNPDEMKSVVSMETSITDMILAAGKTPGTAEFIASWRPVFPEFAHCFPNHKELICIQRTRTADEEPFAISYAFMAPHIIESPDELSVHNREESLHRFIEEKVGQTLVYFEDNIEIVFPDEEVAAKLKVPTTQPIFKFIRFHYNKDKELIVFASDYFNIKTISVCTTRYRLFPRQ